MIRVRGLRKQYGRVAALDGLDLDVPPGAIFGFIGQNGAGKTTTIRILATLLAPDAGAAEVGGVDLRRQAGRARRLVGYVPDFFGVYDDLKVAEYLDFYADLHGVRGGAGARLRDDLLELVELGPRREDYVEHLSRGMQQRLCLARALIHDPPVLLLDEPASGLDPVGRVELREILRELGRMGKTILISSHILSELADLCSHVGMVAAGRMVRQGTVAEVVWAAERPAYLLRVLREPERAAALLARVAGVGGVSTDEDAIRFRADDAEAAAAALAAVVSAEIPVIRFAELEQTLESTFVRLARTGAGDELAGGRHGEMLGRRDGGSAGGRDGGRASRGEQPMRRSSSRHLAISSSRHLAISPSRLTAFASGLALGPRALVRKELRTRSRGWRPMWLLTIYLLVLAVAVAGFLALVERTSPTVPPQIGSMLFAALSVASVLMLALIAPSLTVGAISGERERRTLELLLVTRASPLGLVSGKLLASLIYTLYLLAASLPPFAVVYLFGGVPPEYVAAVIGIATVTALTNAALGLLFSALLRRTALASVVTHSLVVLLVFGLPVLWLFAGQGARLWISLPPTDETVPAPLPPLVPFYISPLLSLLSLLRGLLFTSGALGPAFFPSSTLPITQAVYVLSPVDGSRGSLATVLSWAPWVFQLAFGGVLAALCLVCSALAIAPIKPWQRPAACPSREDHETGAV